MISCVIAYQVNGKIIFLDSLLRSVRWGHVSDGVRRNLYNKILFLQVITRSPISCSSQKILRTSWRNGYSYVKGSLGKDIPSIGTLVGLLLGLTWWAASALLELASLPLTSWCGLCWWPDWSPYWLGARAHVPGDQSWSLQGRVPNFAASSTSGSLKRFFCHQWLVCSNVLTCSWWSLEGLLVATQNWPISYQKVLKNTSSACRHSCVPWKKLVGILVEPL